MKKYVDRWRWKINMRKAANIWTGGGSQQMRFNAGNEGLRNYLTKLPEKIRNQERNKSKKALDNLTRYIKSKRINTPVLYKGLKKKNANNFLKNGRFSTKAPASTSSNRNQAIVFTNNRNVILVIPHGKRYSMEFGKHGINARQPREKEFLLGPGTFVLKGRNALGNYIVNHI
jgi:hypothetical protein